MLSVVDLVRVGTLDLDLAAYLTARVSRGCSFLVGALPGGAGKTTVMCALLNFVPPDCRLVPADSGKTVRDALEPEGRGRWCYICHEIGAGPYYAYLWGRDACDFFALPEAGSMIATNLHADTFEQCRAQLCDAVGVPEKDFRHCRTCLFVHRTGRSWSEQRRRIVAVHESDGRNPHRLVWKWNRAVDEFERVGQREPNAPSDPYASSMRRFISQLLDEEICTIEEVRRRFLDFAASGPSAE